MSSNIENARVSDIVSNEHMINEHMSSGDSSEWEPLTDFENDYEIEIEPPHMIRRRSNGWIVTPTLNKYSGYVQVKLNGKPYNYHRILAKHFIPNPDDLPEVDHEDRDKANNSLDNLRWVNRRKNLKNRIMEQYGKHEYTNDKPNDLIEITNYKGIEYPANKYFFCVENQRVVQRLNEHKWRFLKQTKNNCYLRVTMRDINERIHHILMATLIKSFEQCEK